jgi:phospholipid transport system transporter-binding protein
LSAQVTLGEAGQLKLAGQIDFASAMPLRRQLEQSLAQTSGPVTLDLSGVTRANSVGLSLILLVARILSERGDTLRVVALPDGLKSIARVCELEEWLTSVAA